MPEKARAAFTVIFMLACFDSAAASDEYTFAKLVERQPLMYPRDAQAKRWEGWAYYSYTVGTDGLVRDVRILDSNGLDKLNAALVKNIESGIFEPATYNGIPVEERSKLGRATFLLTGAPRGAGKYFITRFRKLEEALARGEMDDAWALIEELESKDGRSLYEELYLQTKYVEYYSLAGDKDREYLHVSRVLDFYAAEGSKDYIVEPGFFTDFLVRAYQYEIAAMMLGDAFGSAQWLNEVNPDSEVNRQIQAHAETVRKSVENKEFWTTGKLVVPIYGGDISTWDTRLLRREIELRDVAGQIDAVDIYCEHGIKRLSYTPGQGWIIPQSWGDCDLVVTGRSGATLLVAEMPDGTLASGQHAN